MANREKISEERKIIRMYARERYNHDQIEEIYEVKVSLNLCLISFVKSP